MSQFIDGKICDALSRRTGVVRDPSTGEVVSEITQAGAEDVDRAVQAARNAYAEWSRATPADRSAVLTTFARLLSDRAVEIAQLESRIAGKPIRLASEFDVPGTIDNVAFFAGPPATLRARRARSTPRTTRPRSGANPSAWSGPSRRGTIRCRWPHGRSCRRSRPATPLC
jgi:betaine-aldehyde dehydrogenase